MSDTIVFFVTCPGPGEGERIAKHLLRQRLVACVNVIPRIRSFFYSEGKITDEGETLLVCKTTEDRAEGLMDAVKDVHTYKLPEIVGVNTAMVEKKYARWVFDQTRAQQEE